ncbi:MAG: ATP-binding protein [Methanomassiliicoccales archaeon]|jgi:signal transduction histidine kinase/sensor domain CHASE-containing protein/FixJ family two-component response regulator
MKVGTKILLITLGCLACLVLAFFSVASVLLVDNFDNLENTNATINTQQAVYLLNNELQTLDSNSRSYANWDQTYSFANGTNPDYMKMVFPESTFKNLGINAVIITNSTYDVITRLYYDGGIRALPTGFFDHLDKTHSDLLVQGMGAGGLGIIMVDSTPYMVSARPIHHSIAGDNSGNPAGVFILAKMIDKALQNQITEQLTSQKLQVTLINYGDYVSGFGNVSEYGSQVVEHGTTVKIMGENKITGLTVINDLYKKPALIVQVDGYRTLYKQAVNSEIMLLLSLLMLSIILFIVTVILLQFFVTSRIDKLNDGVRRIDDNGGGGEKIEVKSNDDLGSLAASINRMVDGLEASKRDLLQSERRYKAVVEDQTELVFRSTPEGIVTFANTAFLRFYGVSKEQSYPEQEEAANGSDPGMYPLGEFLPVPPNERARVQHRIKELNKEEPVFEHEHEFRSTAMESRWFQWTIRGVFSDEGKLIEIQWVGRDVTDRIRLLERLNKIDKIESLGVFAGGIAHDFNNYLTSIMGTLTLMRKTVSRTDPRIHRLEEAEHSVMKATELTKQLLTFSKGGEPIKKTMSVSNLLRETAQFGLRGSDITMSLEFAENLSCVEADEGQMFQVLSNLIINAKQAMPKGGNIQIVAKDVELEEDSDIPLPVGRYVMITIKDNGVGIPPDILVKIFDPFFTTKADGNGLGLTIVHSIISKHDGFIDVDSVVGVGTTFTIYLPASEEKIEAKPTREDVKETEFGKVLIMDDEEPILEVGSELLRMNGYTVDCAYKGEEALTLYSKAWEEGEPYHVVILDLTIRGGMGGKETISKLLEMDPNARAIVSSGYSNDPVMANYKDYGFLGMVPKPYGIRDMLDEVRRVLNVHEENIKVNIPGQSRETENEASL